MLHFGELDRPCSAHATTDRQEPSLVQRHRSNRSDEAVAVLSVQSMRVREQLREGRMHTLFLKHGDIVPWPTMLR